MNELIPSAADAYDPEIGALGPQFPQDLRAVEIPGSLSCHHQYRFQGALRSVDRGRSRVIVHPMIMRDRRRLT